MIISSSSWDATGNYFQLPLPAVAQGSSDIKFSFSKILNSPVCACCNKFKYQSSTIQLYIILKMMWSGNFHDNYIGRASRSRTRRLDRFRGHAHLPCSLGLATHLHFLRQFRCIRIWTICTIEMERYGGDAPPSLDWKSKILLLN